MWDLNSDGEFEPKFGGPLPVEFASAQSRKRMDVSKSFELLENDAISLIRQLGSSNSCHQGKADLCSSVVLVTPRQAGVTRKNTVK